MTTVFVGGSRAVSRLNTEIRQRLDDLIGHRCQILVGDANGADKAVQEHLAARAYRHVIVFSMNECRNNIGNWETRAVIAEAKKRDFAYYALKDLAMAREARCGLMLWDGRSRGTVSNIVNLIGAGKKVLVYLAPDRQFYKLTTPGDLQGLLRRCSRRDLERLQNTLARLPLVG